VVRDGWLLEAAPAPGRPLWVWGRGHVGRAIVSVLAPWPGAAITWVDLGPDRFPARVPEGVTVLPAPSPRRWSATRPRTPTTSSSPGRMSSTSSSATRCWGMGSPASG
jgi:xanthine dehydrogenase accessory factor